MDFILRRPQRVMFSSVSNVYNNPRSVLMRSGPIESQQVTLRVYYPPLLLTCVYQSVFSHSAPGRHLVFIERCRRENWPLVCLRVSCPGVVRLMQTQNKTSRLQSLCAAYAGFNTATGLHEHTLRVCPSSITSSSHVLLPRFIIPGARETSRDNTELSPAEYFTFFLSSKVGWLTHTDVFL